MRGLGLARTGAYTCSVARAAESTFVAEFALEVGPAQRGVIERRLRLATHCFNRCLQVGLDRLSALRADPRWKAIGQLPHPQRGAAYRELRREHLLSDYHLQAVGTEVRRCYLGEHLGAHEAQTLATRAFRAVEQHMYGRRGRPRFKPSRRWLDSMEGKGPTSAVRYGVRRVEGRHAPVLLWGSDVALPLRLEAGNPVHLWAALCVAGDGVRHARLVRRRIKGRRYYYAQLVLRGQPCPRRQTGAGRVGADVGPSTIAVVADGAVALERFCAELLPQQQRIRRLQRRLDRQHRAGSPACFDERGRHAKGRCPWSRSRRAQLTGAALAEALRRLAAQRRGLHGNLANRVLSHGTDIRIERLSYRAFQRGFPRSVRDRAPGMFVSLLRRKAASAGGGVVEFATRTTALSQVCVCGRRERKALSLRVHACPCGITAQRDVFSAFLARHVDPLTQALDAEAAACELRSRHDIAGGRRPPQGRTGDSGGATRRLDGGVRRSLVVRTPQYPPVRPRERRAAWGVWDPRTSVWGGCQEHAGHPLRRYSVTAHDRVGQLPRQDQRARRSLRATLACIEPQTGVKSSS